MMARWKHQPNRAYLRQWRNAIDAGTVSFTETHPSKPYLKCRELPSPNPDGIGRHALRADNSIIVPPPIAQSGVCWPGFLPTWGPIPIPQFIKELSNETLGHWCKYTRKILSVDHLHSVRITSVAHDGRALMPGCLTGDGFTI